MLLYFAGFRNDNLKAGTEIPANVLLTYEDLNPAGQCKQAKVFKRLLRLRRGAGSGGSIRRGGQQARTTKNTCFGRHKG